MYIAFLRYPGAWIDGADAFALQSLVAAADSLITQAAVAAFGFDTSMAAIVNQDPVERGAVWDRRRAELYAEHDKSGAELDTAALARMDATIRSEQLRAGVMPRSCDMAIVQCHCNAYLYAMDMLAKVFGEIHKLRPVAAIETAILTMAQHFPDLREVRNSVQHLEERTQGLRNAKPIKPRPIDTPGLRSTGGAMVIGQIDENRFGTTMGDGTYGQVEVSVAKLEVAVKCLQRVIDALAWSGPERLVPSFD